MGRIAGVSPQETRRRLLAAAARVFAQQGYEGARVADIAREAGVTTGAIYAHYRTRADLLAEAIHAHGEEELADLVAAWRPTSLRDLLEGLGRDLVRVRRRDSPQLLVEAIVAGRRDRSVARRLRDGVAEREELLARAIGYGQESGEIDPALPAEAMARFCFTLSIGALVVGALGLPQPDPDEWAAVIHRLVGAIAPEPAVRPPAERP